MKALLWNKVEAVLCLVVLIQLSSNLFGQADYSFLNEICYVVDIDGDTVSTGNLLMEDMLTDDQLDIFTLRYDSDTVITNRNGQLVPVSREFDIYMPDDSLSLSYAGGEINKLPVILMLHSGQGTKDSIATSGLAWARRGYVVFIPTYRSDRLGADYCFIYTKSLYLAAQDISAVVRTFSFLYDDSLLPESNIDGNPLIGRRVDGESIFYNGFSYGGSLGFHAVSRMIQEQWEPFLGAGEEYLVDGEDGTVDLGDAGLLHSTGADFLVDYEFPYERIKGVLSRTAAIFKPGQLSFDLSPVKVPAQIICGTCDQIIPYQQNTFVNDEGLCDARIFYPDGSSDTTITFYGPQYISDQMDAADIYHELITFCNGGHNTNLCVLDYINAAEVRFVTKILGEAFDNSEVYEEVYRYQFENSSNQCCELVEGAYSYLDKCNCESDNPFNVVDLPFINLPGCQFANQCDLDPICELIPISDCENESLTLTIALDQNPGETTWEINSGASVVASGGLYGNAFTTVFEDICLPADCYTITFFDSFGDGFCCDFGIGSYTLTDASGAVLASGGEFLVSETSTFCLTQEAGCEVINFNDYPVLSYIPSLDNGFWSLQEGGTAIVLQGNSLKYIPIDYNVTPNTTMSFEYRSTFPGSIHAIAMETDQNLSLSRLFKLHGSLNNNTVISDFNNYSGTGFQSYVIDIGNYYTGNNLDLVVLTANLNGLPGNNSSFRNVRIYEGGACGSAALLQGSSTASEDGDFVLFPNPTKDHVELTSLSGVDIQTVQVFSMTGALIDEVIVNRPRVVLEFSDKSQGIYLIRWTDTNGQNHQERLVKSQ